MALPFVGVGLRQAAANDRLRSRSGCGARQRPRAPAATWRSALRGSAAVARLLPARVPAIRLDQRLGAEDQQQGRQHGTRDLGEFEAVHDPQHPLCWRPRPHPGGGGSIPRPSSYRYPLTSCNQTRKLSGLEPSRETNCHRSRRSYAAYHASRTIDRHPRPHAGDPAARQAAGRHPWRADDRPRLAARDGGGSRAGWWSRPIARRSPRPSARPAARR